MMNLKEQNNTTTKPMKANKKFNYLGCIPIILGIILYIIFWYTVIHFIIKYW
jgi:uncharacterized membrane protein